MLPAKRGDLAVIRTVSRLSYQCQPTDSVVRYELAVVTSITRDKIAKAVRMITGRDAAAGKTKPTAVTKLPRSGMVILPATELRVTDAIAAILDRHASTETGYLPACHSPLDLLRDLHPWTVGDTTCLDEIRSAAYRFLQVIAPVQPDDDTTDTLTRAVRVVTRAARANSNDQEIEALHNALQMALTRWPTVTYGR